MQIAVRMCDGHNDLAVCWLYLLFLVTTIFLFVLVWQVLACDFCREENTLFALSIFAKIKQRKFTVHDNHFGILSLLPATMLRTNHRLSPWGRP